MCIQHALAYLDDASLTHGKKRSCKQHVRLVVIARFGRVVITRSGIDLLLHGKVEYLYRGKF